MKDTLIPVGSIPLLRRRMYNEQIMSSIWLKWQEGRQETGYLKMLLLSSYVPFPFDIYLLKYVERSFVPNHRDAVEKGQHYRLNVILKKAQRGGDFICEGAIIDWPRIKLFRPDACEHSITTVEKGSRLVLSIGWIWRARQ
jgi:hypothetical protein